MPKCDLVTIVHIMNRTIASLVDSSVVTSRTDTDPAAFFGFRPEDVACIHFRKTGVGEGVWFRLRDGRVFNRYGGVDDPADCGRIEGERPVRRTKSGDDAG